MTTATENTLNERIIMQAVLRNPYVVGVTTRIGLFPSHFQSKFFGEIYGVAQRLFLERGDDITPMDLAAACVESDRFNKAEKRRLEQVGRNPPSKPLGNLVSAAEKMVAKDLAHSANGAMESWQKMYAANPIKAARSLAPLSMTLLNLTEGVHEETGAPSDIIGLEDEADDILCIPTGIQELDSALKIDEGLDGGFRKRRLFVVGMPPGHGKSATATYWACQVARQGFGVVVFSLELDAMEFLERCMCNMSGLGMWKVKSRKKRTQQDQEMYEIARNSLDSHIRIFTTGHEAEEMSVRVRAAAHSLDVPLGLVIVDHIGLVDPKKDTTTVKDGQWLRLEQTCYQIRRDVAQRHDVCTVLFSQLPEELVATFKKTNTVPDARFRGSQGIKNAADVAIIAGRHNGLDKAGDPDPFMANMSAWTIHKVRWNGNVTRFDVNYDPKTFSYSKLSAF